MAQNIARLGVVMGLDTTEFQKNLESVNQMMDGLKDKLLEFGTIAGFSEMTAKAMEYADTVVKTAKANDVTTASVLELSKALEENGGAAEDTGRLYSGFTQKVETAALGSAKAQESFARVGVSLNDLKTLSSQDLFSKTIEGLGKINDAATRNGLAFQVLGKSIRGVDIQGLAETLDEVKGKFDQYSESVNQAHALHLQLEASGRMISLAFTQAFIPTMAALAKAFSDTTKEEGGFVGFITDVINVLGVLFRYTTTVVVALVDTLKLAGSELKNVLSGNFGAIVDTYKQYDDKIKAMVEADAKFSDNLLNPKQGSGGSGDAQGSANREVINANATKLNSAKDLTAEYKKHADLTLQMALQARDLLTLTNDQKNVQIAINKVIDDNQKAQDAIDKQIAAARGTQGGGALIAEYEKQKQAIADLRDTYVNATKEQVQATIDFQRTFSFGWDKAFAQYAEDSQNYGKMAQDMFTSFTNNMNTALDNFVTTGKLNFSSLATSIIQDLLKIQLKMLMMQSLSGASGLFSGIFGGGVASAFTNPAAGGSFTGAGFQLPAFANGGDINGPAIVGENGPEIFMPNRAGTIIPNNKLGGAMGATTNVTNNYIQAIDTKSFEDRLYGSNKAIWAANQYADKNLATSRSRT